MSKRGHSVRGNPRYMGAREWRQQGEGRSSRLRCHRLPLFLRGLPHCNVIYRNGPMGWDRGRLGFSRSAGKRAGGLFPQDIPRRSPSCPVVRAGNCPIVPPHASEPGKDCRVWAIDRAPRKISGFGKLSPYKVWSSPIAPPRAIAMPTDSPHRH